MFGNEISPEFKYIYSIVFKFSYFYYHLERELELICIWELKIKPMNKCKDKVTQNRYDPLNFLGHFPLKSLYSHYSIPNIKKENYILQYKMSQCPTDII